MPTFCVREKRQPGYVGTVLNFSVVVSRSSEHPEAVEGEDNGHVTALPDILSFFCGGGVLIVDMDNMWCGPFYGSDILISPEGIGVGFILSIVK